MAVAMVGQPPPKTGPRSVAEFPAALQQAVAERNLAAIAGLFDPGYVEHDPDGLRARPGPESVERKLAEYYRAFPGLVLRVNGQVLDEQRYCSAGKGAGRRPAGLASCHQRGDKRPSAAP